MILKAEQDGFHSTCTFITDVIINNIHWINMSLFYFLYLTFQLLID